MDNRDRRALVMAGCGFGLLLVMALVIAVIVGAFVFIIVSGFLSA